MGGVDPSLAVVAGLLAFGQAIFSGSVQSWAEVGGPDQRITVVVRSLGIVDSTVTAVAIDGVEPSVAHLLSGTYTFVRPFLLVWPKGRTLDPLAQAFMDYVMSPSAQEELAPMGLVTGPGDG